jgi:hypothetical protein
MIHEHGVKRGKPLSDVRLSSPTTVLYANINTPAESKRNTKIAIFIN